MTLVCLPHPVALARSRIIRDQDDVTWCDANKMRGTPTASPANIAYKSDSANYCYPYTMPGVQWSALADEAGAMNDPSWVISYYTVRFSNKIG